MRCLDFTGKEIKAGCDVAYPVRQGSRLWLDRVAVDRVEFFGLDVDHPYILHGYKSNGRRVRIKNIKTTVIV